MELLSFCNKALTTVDNRKPGRDGGCCKVSLICACGRFSRFSEYTTRISEGMVFADVQQNDLFSLKYRLIADKLSYLSLLASRLTRDIK